MVGSGCAVTSASCVTPLALACRAARSFLLGEVVLNPAPVNAFLNNWRKGFSSTTVGLALITSARTSARLGFPLAFTGDTCSFPSTTALILAVASAGISNLGAALGTTSASASPNRSPWTGAASGAASFFSFSTSTTGVVVSGMGAASSSNSSP